MDQKKQYSVAYERIVDTPKILKSLLIICLSASLVIGSAFMIVHGLKRTTISITVLGLISLALLFLHQQGHYQISGLLLFLVVSVVLTYNISIGHAIFDEAMIAYPLLIVFGGLLFGKRTVVLVTSITVAQLILVYLLALRGIVRPFDGALKVGLEETITTLIILIATGFILWAVVDIIEATVQKILISEVELENAHDLTLEAWAKALELRGREVPGHSSRVTALSVQLAEHLGLDQEAVKQVRWGALLHDIGKMGIPEKLLLKSGPLTKEEWEVISRHTILAREIIKDIPYFEGALEIVRHHHEQYDGHGYPNQIKAAEIPISALLFSIVDNWDMLRSNRPYSSAWTDEKTIAYLKKESGKKFHPGIVDAFLSLIEETGN